MVDTAAALANNITEQERDKAEASPPALVLVPIMNGKGIASSPIITAIRTENMYWRTPRGRYG